MMTMTIDEFKTIAKNAQGILFGFYVYNLELDYNNGEGFAVYNIICDEPDEAPTVIRYADIKSITYNKENKEYTICYNNSNWPIKFSLLTLM